MRTKYLLIFLLAGAFSAVGCGLDDHTHDFDHAHEDESEQEVECPEGQHKCETPVPAVELAVRPGGAESGSRVAWHPVDGASSYQLVMTRLDEEDNRSEVFTVETDGLHAQVPKEHRDTSRASLQVKALGDDGESIGDSDRIPFACLECGYQPMICSAVCEGPAYGYSIQLSGDATTYLNASSRIAGSGHHIAYSFDDYWDAWDNNINNFRNRPFYEEYIQGVSSDPVYDRFCGSQLTGRVYFVQADAGVYQYAVNEGMTSHTYANDGQAMCGTYGGGGVTNAIGGMTLLFNATSDISPALTCPANCNLNAGGGGTGWPGPWVEIDSESFPSPIEIADDILDGSPTEPGWWDDVPVVPILGELAEHAFDRSGDDAPPELVGLSIRKAVPDIRDTRRDGGDRIQIDLERLQQEGDTYIDEIAKQLENGELYLLVRYYGGIMVRPMALMHR